MSSTCTNIETGPTYAATSATLHDRTSINKAITLHRCP